LLQVTQGQFLLRFTGLRIWQSPVISFSLAGASQNNATPQWSKPQLNGSIFNLKKRSEAMSDNLNEAAAENNVFAVAATTATHTPF